MIFVTVMLTKSTTEISINPVQFIGAVEIELAKILSYENETTPH